MEYICAEEFLKQPKNVQEVFIDWWKPSKGDLFTNDITGGFGVISQDELFNNGLIPLLTEGQLRKFIEDKTGCKTSVEWFFFLNPPTYAIDLDLPLDSENDIKDFYNNLGTDLLQAYWKVACEIAKGEC